MAEERFLVIRAGEWSYALTLEEALAVIDAPAKRPLPKCKAWCSGWVAFKGQVVPVLGGADYSGLGPASMLVIVERQGVLLGLPCQEATILAGVSCHNGGDEMASGLPAAGDAEMDEKGRAVRPDLPKLYSVLGIQ